MMNKRISFLWLILCLVIVSCSAVHKDIKPQFVAEIRPQELAALPSPFPPLTITEMEKDWGKDLRTGVGFARELDLYRAITFLKSALFSIPHSELVRRQEIEYDILLCYYLGKQYKDVIAEYESGKLGEITNTFPALQDLLLMVHDSYIQMGNPEKATWIFSLIESNVPEKAKEIHLSQAVLQAKLDAIIVASAKDPAREHFSRLIEDYRSKTKSVDQAQMLQAILPGAGYLYVGQRGSAVTSFLLNTLFIAAAYNFFNHHNIAAGIITTGFEMGWYFGGIYGAGLAAREYNERLYETYGNKMLFEERLFPLFMLQYSF